MPKVLVVGGGYAGLYVAGHLQKRLRRGEAEVAVVHGGGPRVHR